MELSGKRIIISKTNQIGDVTFSLPIASVLKKHDPSCKILFMGRHYTQALIEQYVDVDEFVDWELISALSPNERVAAFRALRADIIIHVHPNKALAWLAKRAKIPHRIGTRNRLFHWFTCNYLPAVSRKKSPLHETQLDMHYLKAFGIKSDYTLQEIVALRQFRPMKLSASVLSLLDPHRFNLILHPKTRGQHIEWPTSHFAELIQCLPVEQFKIFVTGSAEEGEKIRDEMIAPFPHVVDLMGKTTLNEMLGFIGAVDGLIAASTGPVHLAANYGVNTLGLYAPIKPFDATRWGPVGERATVLSLNKACGDCRKSGPCHCVAEISPEEVYKVVMQWQRKNISQDSLHANT